MENNLTSFNLYTFSLDGVSNNLTSLNYPIEVLPWESFSAFKNDNSVLLTWSMVPQVNTKGYSIEYSVNAVNWEQVGFLPNSGGNEAVKTHSFTHVNLVKGKHYYRIHQVDMNGKPTYSDIKMISI